MLTLNDVLRAEGIDPTRVLVVRHTPYAGDEPAKKAKACLNADMIREYTSIQRSDTARKASSEGRNLWMVFVADRKGVTRLYGVYLHDGTTKTAVMESLPEDFPAEAAPCPEDTIYTLDDTDVMLDYVDRLRVNWNGRPYLRKAETNTFEVEAIDVRGSVPFPGFDDIHLTRGELTGMYANPGRYESWRSAMAAVQAVYVIACTACGRLYVGSATGAENLWQRWGDYAASGDGSADNRDLARHVAEHPDHLAKFQYSVLQTFAPGTDPNLVVAAEGRFKLCLDSVNNGMNANW